MAISDAWLKANHGKTRASREERMDRDGFGIRITPAGKIIFQMRYRYNSKNPKRLDVGSYPLMSLKEARVSAFFLCGRKVILTMQIHISGSMTIKQLKQTLFEKLNEVHDEYAVGHVKGATLYFHPTDEIGQEVILMKAGRRVNKILTNGPYKCAADEYSMGG